MSPSLTTVLTDFCVAMVTIYMHLIQPIISGGFVQVYRSSPLPPCLPPLTVSLPPSGHTCHELFALRTGRIGRIPDLVVWAGMYVSFVHVCITYRGGVVFSAGSHEDVESIVQAAAKHDVVIIPFGGTCSILMHNVYILISYVHIHACIYLTTMLEPYRLMRSCDC